MFAAGVMPTSRYQHSAVFVNARLHISGGAVGGGRMVDESAAVVVLDTGAGVWCTQAPVEGPVEDWTRRCRHAVAAVGQYVFIYGGLRGGTLLEDFLLADDSSGSELSICDPRSPAWQAAHASFSSNLAWHKRSVAVLWQAAVAGLWEGHARCGNACGGGR